jgi:hypothetical protein
MPPEITPSQVTRREFHTQLALWSTAGIMASRAAQPDPGAGEDPDLQAGVRIVRRDAESLRVLPLDGLPPAFTPQAR